MAIRNRTWAFDGNVATSQTALVLAAFRVPAIARIKSVRGTAVGTAAGNSVGVYVSATNIADDTGANSTTLVHDAVLAVVANDTIVADPMTGQYRVPKGAWLYIKATTGGTAFTNLSVSIDFDM